MLDQRITSVNQQKWITKLLGLDYEIIYKKGRDNIAAGSLSRQFEHNLEEEHCHALTVTVPLWLQELQDTWDTDEELQHIISQLVINPAGITGYRWHQGKLTFNGKLVVRNKAEVRQKIIGEFHENAV